MDARLVKFANNAITITIDGRVYNHNGILVLRNCIKWYCSTPDGYYAVTLVDENGDVFWFDNFYSDVLDVKKEFHVNPRLLNSRYGRDRKYKIKIFYGNDLMLVKSSDGWKFIERYWKIYNSVKRNEDTEHNFSREYILDMFDNMLVTKSSHGYNIMSIHGLIINFNTDVTDIIDTTNRLVCVNRFVFAYGNNFFHDEEADDDENIYLRHIILESKYTNILRSECDKYYIETEKMGSIGNVYIYDPDDHTDTLIKVAGHGKIALDGSHIVMISDDGFVLDLEEGFDVKFGCIYPQPYHTSKLEYTKKNLIHVSCADTYKFPCRMYDMEFMW